METDKLERIVRFYPAYDRRPGYGVHGVEMAFYLRGPEGAIQFKVSTQWQLLHIMEEMDARTLSLARRGVVDSQEMATEIKSQGFQKMVESLDKARRLLGDVPGKLDGIQLKVTYHPLPVDVGYHSYIPRYEGQKTITQSCELLGGKPCYYDGSSLRAQEFFDLLVEQGDEAVWKKIEEEYRFRLLDQKDDMCPECGQARPGDDRVRAGMKCGLCSYPTYTI